MATAGDILVVDDDEDCCTNLAEILSDFGYRVDTAFRGWDALDLAEQKRYQLALLDLKLPCMSGVELFDRLREKQGDIQGVIVTAFSTPDVDTKAASKGVERVLSKPIDFDTLLPLVQSLAGEPN